jgi:hypothetical protein
MKRYRGMIRRVKKLTVTEATFAVSWKPPTGRRRRRMWWRQRFFQHPHGLHS